MAATGGIALVYLISFVVRMFGVNVSFLHDSSPLSIGISLFVVAIAGFEPDPRFRHDHTGADARAEIHGIVSGAFGLMVTLIWLYLEMLRLL